MGKIWAVCSGSGGTGKTTVALSLAAGAAKSGKKTILLDASGSARSADLALRMESIVALDMISVLRDQVSIVSALYDVPQYEYLQYVCASFSEGVSVSELSGMITVLCSLCDILVIDLPTGQTYLGRGVLRTGDERLLVLCADDASIRSAETMLSACQGDTASSSLIINHFSKERIKRKIQHSQDTVQNLLDCPVIAVIPEDTSIPVCASNGRTAIECDGPAWTALSSLVKNLLGSV